MGVAAWRLGAGRARKEDPVSAAAGVMCLVKPGQAVAQGQALLELHTEWPSRIAWALEALEGGIVISDKPPARVPVVLEVVK